ncbi:RNA-directed DNA polymerase from mobile element jockey [Labeo rohita]|uniref:RNA-directed DNA polymerase from mobile element jockey n=1 Tax=Labeo rohita TaxID=84645 RepID=A0ABQ8L7B5_LABRO|nr:RNA-directed DNA polymerase from mobile element jockey [Labeo rohita]
MGWWFLMTLVILQWNARSLIANGQEFKKYVPELIDRPHVICVQETWLKPQLEFVMYGYTSIRKDRETGKGGGVATFIKNGIRYKLISKGIDNESVVIRVWSGESSIKVVNFYNPCSRLNTDILESVCGSMQGKIVVCGDFNTHSTLWGSNDADNNGSVVEEFIDDKELVCINDGKGTRYNSSSNTESAIDLTLVSNEIAGISTWEVKDRSTVGSDHYPIITRIGIEVQQDSEVNIPRWKLDKADWQAFQEMSETKCMELLNKNITNVEEMNDEIVNSIIQIAEETIPKSRGNKRKKSVPWWDESCRKAVKSRNKAFGQLKAHHTIETLINYKRVQAIVRKMIRSAKRTHWREFCNKIGNETQLSDIWRVIRRMSGVGQSVEIPVLCSNNQCHVMNERLEPEVSRDELINSFSSVLTIFATLSDFATSH